MTKLFECPACEKPVKPDGETCPNCGAALELPPEFLKQQNDPTMLIGCFGIAFLTVLALIVGVAV
ncbi:MAG: zinc ribbon domain-containing protein [Parvularculales bacterium]